MIEHKVFGDGVQAVRYIPKGKTMATLSAGIMELGARHDFGIISRLEHIQVTYGWITINGTVYSTGEVCIIQPGTQVIMESPTESSYLCTFPGETR